MSKMGVYAIQRQEELSKRGRGKKNQEPGNVPTVLRDQYVDAKIAECVIQGLDEVAANALVVTWNSIQPSPMKVGHIKKRIYIAYHSQQAAGK